MLFGVSVTSSVQCKMGREEGKSKLAPYTESAAATELDVVDEMRVGGWEVLKFGTQMVHGSQFALVIYACVTKHFPLCA